MNKKLISIILPVYNEADNLPDLQFRLWAVFCKLKKDYCFEIIYVNDGSSDNSLKILLESKKKYKQPGLEIKIIDFLQNHGHQAALLAGLTNAKGDYLITMDSDLQDRPELIPNMIDKAKDGYDVVVARKLNYADHSIFKRFFSSLFYKLYKLIIDPNIILDAGDFRLVTKETNQKMLNLISDRIFLRGLVSKASQNIADIAYYRSYRQSGKAKFTFLKSFKLALDGFLLNKKINPNNRSVFYQIKDIYN